MYEILIVDPEPLTRRGLVMTLNSQPDMNVCADVSDGESALGHLQSSKPDVIITEIALPGMSGLVLGAEVLKADPEIRIIMVSRQDSAACAERVLRSGAHGYLGWRDKPDVFTGAIRHVVLGGFFVSPRVTDSLFQAIAEASNPLIPSPSDVLSERELELFGLIGDGLDVNRIAERMTVSPKTVASYRARIREKMNLRSNVELMRRATQWCSGDCVCFSKNGHAAATPQPW